MSRMAIPTMEVVRFKEDDIIVASGRSAGIRNFGTGTVGDAYIQVTNGINFTADWAFLKDEVDKEHEHDSFLNPGMTFYVGDNSITLGTLVSGGDADGLYAQWNGDYKNVGDGWHKQ